MNLTITIDIGPHIRALGGILMATLNDFTTALDEIKAGIDALKANDDALKAQVADLEARLAAGGLTAEEEATVLARLVDLKAQLTPTA